MLRIDAPAVAADVVDDHPRRDGSAHAKPRHPVSAPVFTPEIESAVPVLVEWALPLVAAVGQLYILAAESFILFFGQHVDYSCAFGDCRVPHAATGTQEARGAQ